MNVPSSSAATVEAAPPTTPPASVAQREVKHTTWLVVGALLLGTVLQVWLPPDAPVLVLGALLAGALVVGVMFLAPGRLRETLAGFRFISTLLFVLAVFAVLGTLVLQMKPHAFYIDQYGFAGKLIVALRLDDIFHGLPLALVTALFGASIIASATLRWPVRLKSAGFFICHVGLIASLAGGAVSSTLAIRGRIDLHAGGEHATHVRVTKAGQPTGEYAALGFDLHLDKFDAPSYETAYRVGYYEQVVVNDEHGIHPEWKLTASFDPDLEKHRLPNGDSFQLKSINDQSHAVVAEVHQGGIPKARLMVAGQGQTAFFLSPTRALLIARRADEKRAYISWGTARQGETAEQRVISVNDPMSFNGWTIYQVNYNPQDPTYSGFEAVYDPGVAWVFFGFVLICLGVFYMFYVEPRLKKAAKSATAAAAAKA